MATPSASQSKSALSFIPEKYQDWIFPAITGLLILIFLGKAIFGNGFNASDNIASESFQPFLQEAAKKGEFPQWLPYIFSGLPSYAALLTTGNRTWDFSSFIVSKISYAFAGILGSDTARIAFWYIVYATGMYFLMRMKKHERMVALFTSISAVFSTWILTWVMIGHNTKPIAFAMFPYILLCLENVREKWSLKYAVLLVLAVHVMVESTHMQMVFYGICTFGLYLLFELVSRLITRKQPMGVLRAALVLAVAGAMSFGMGADRFLSTLEYTPYSTRGSAPISQIMQNGDQKQKSANVQDANGGNDYDYATGWSFSPEEMMTFFVPDYYGFGKLHYKGPLTGNRDMILSSYFGQMAFTDAANYMGICVLFLGLFGAWRFRRDLFVQFLITLSVFALFLSFGRNLSFLYDFFYYHVPMFNKFRAPSMVLALMQFAMPILAAYGVAGMGQLREEKEASKRRPALYLLVICGVFFISGLVYPSMVEESYRAQVEQSRQVAQYGDNAEVKTAIGEFVFGEMRSDWLTTGFFALLLGGIVWMYVNKKLSAGMFYPLLIVISLVDLWRVDVRPMDIPKKKIESDVFKKTDLIDFLTRDTSVFRIADLDVLPSPNVAAYFKLENIHGYHSAKMRVYQDLMDEAGNGGGSIIQNPLLWNLLNVKYITSQKAIFPNMQPVFTSASGNGLVYQNPAMLPRAFFVKQAVVASRTDILKHLKDGDFFPVDTAYVEAALPQTIDTTITGAQATLVERKNEYQKYMVTAPGTQSLLYVSEVYYPVSWHAFVDGQETPIYKTNFAFRSVIVPKGQHTVEFKYESPKFEEGKTISLAANLLLLAGAVGAVFIEWRGRSKTTSAPHDEAQA